MSIGAPTLAATFYSSGNVTGGTPSSVAIGTTIPAGSWVEVHVGGSVGSGTVAVSDSQGNSYTELGPEPQGTGSATTTDVFVGITTHALVAGTDTISVTRSTTSSVNADVEFRTGVSGLRGSAQVQAVGTGANPVTFPAITLTAGDVMVVKADTAAAITSVVSLSTGAAQDYLHSGFNRTSYGITVTGQTGSTAPSLTTDAGGSSSGQVYSAIAFALIPAAVGNTDIDLGCISL